MYCKNCGKETDNNSNYCPNCGSALNSRADIDTLERIGSYAPYDKSDHLYNIITNRKETPVRGTLGVLPLFGIMGVVLMIIALIITLYSYNMIDGLQKNLLQYYNQITDNSLAGKIGSPIIDFFTGGALTQKRQDITKMEQDLRNGKDIMSVGLLCAVLSVLTGLAGVLRNIKKPSEGRIMFLFAYIFSLITPVLVLIACTMLFLINTWLIVTVTASLLAFIMLIVESQRIKIVKVTYNHNYPRKRPIRVKAVKE